MQPIRGGIRDAQPAPKSVWCCQKSHVLMETRGNLFLLWQTQPSLWHNVSRRCSTASLLILHMHR